MKKIIYFLLFAAPAGIAQAGYVPPSNPLRQIVEQMPEKTWAKVNANFFNSVWTPTQYAAWDNSYGTKTSAIIEAWSSFAWDSNRGNLMIYGGGHGNYVGNDVYIWKSSTLAWERASLPTKIYQMDPINSPNLINTVDNGVTPLSAHTYDNNVFLTQSDRFLTFGGYTFAGVGYYRENTETNTLVSTGPYVFDPAKAYGDKVGGATGTGADPTTPGGDMWQNRDIYANLQGSRLPSGFYEGMTAQTVEDGKDVVYVVGVEDPYKWLYRYQINDINDPTQDEWTLVGARPTFFVGQGAGAYDPEQKIFMLTGLCTSVADPCNSIGTGPDTTPYNHPFLFWDLNRPLGTSNPLQTLYPIDETGGVLPTSLLKSTGLDYDPLRKQYVLWAGGNYVYTLAQSEDDGNWRLSIENLDGGIGPGGVNLASDFDGMAGGVLGKWHYASDFGVFVGLRDPLEGEIWVYKPAGFVDVFGVDETPALFLFIAGLPWLLFGGRQSSKPTSKFRNNA